MWPNSSERVSRVGDGFSGQQGKENVASCPRPLILPGTPTDKASPRQPLMPSFPVSWLSGQGPSLSLNFAATLLLPFFWKPKGDISSEKPPQPWQAEVRALPRQPLPGILFPAFTNAFSIHCPRACPPGQSTCGNHQLHPLVQASNSGVIRIPFSYLLAYIESIIKFHQLQL